MAVKFDDKIFHHIEASNSKNSDKALDLEHYVLEEPPKQRLSDGNLNPIFKSLKNEDMFKQIFGFDTSKDAWFTLEKSYSSKSKAKVVHIKEELQNLKKNNPSIFDYVLKIKLLVMNLTQLGLVYQRKKN